VEFLSNIQDVYVRTYMFGDVSDWFIIGKIATTVMVMSISFGLLNQFFKLL
jgi:hypothetical protein